MRHLAVTAEGSIMMVFDTVAARSVAWETIRHALSLPLRSRILETRNSRQHRVLFISVLLFLLFVVVFFVRRCRLGLSAESIVDCRR
jgi:branched-subunit amino acid ABC-type transport system permease component